MSWLSRLEAYQKTARDINEFEAGKSYPETEGERMARVIREQSAVLKNGPWNFVGGGVVGGGYECRYCQTFLKAYLSPDGIGPIDFMERHKKDCIWRNLSPDAKEVVEECD